jgi:hypothetical protein
LDISDVDCIYPSLSIRNLVNKEIGRLNTQEWNIEISAFDCRDLQLLQVYSSFFSAAIALYF